MGRKAFRARNGVQRPKERDPNTGRRCYYLNENINKTDMADLFSNSGRSLLPEDLKLEAEAARAAANLPGKQ